MNGRYQLLHMAYEVNQMVHGTWYQVCLIIVVVLFFVAVVYCCDCFFAATASSFDVFAMASR